MGISSILLFLYSLRRQGDYPFPLSIAVKMGSYTNMNGGFPPVPDDYYSTCGLVHVGLETGRMSFSRTIPQRIHSSWN
ncbi:hypothetical protein B0H14DRAFT_1022220 [Mycena olivaceomarginata]|nr:hypothetical protein B0H14DRAFT_1022220 [Mycena olivaceomarginata]